MPVSSSELRALSHASDEELMQRFQADNSEAAYTLLVRRYKSAIVNFLYRFTGSYDDALDIAQETFLRLYRYKHSYNPEQRFSTWLYTIAANLARGFYQRQQRSATVPFSALSGGEDPDEERSWEPPDTQYLPDTRVDTTLIAQRVQAALMQLPPSFREIVILREIMELSYEEIAKITQTELGTVKSRLNRARQRLQELLRDLYEELYGNLSKQP